MSAEYYLAKILRILENRTLEKPMVRVIQQYNVQCPKCGRWFDDETRSKDCPHEET